MFTFGIAWICPRLPCPSVATVASIRTLIILNTDDVVGERERNRPERDGLQTESEPKVRMFRPGGALQGWMDGGVSGHISTIIFGGSNSHWRTTYPFLFRQL